MYQYRYSRLLSSICNDKIDGIGILCRSVNVMNIFNSSPGRKRSHSHRHYTPLYLWFLSGFPWYRVATSNEATELRVPFVKVESFTVATMTWLTAMEYLCHKINTSRSFPHSWLITRFVTRWTRRVSLVEQELPTILEHKCSPLVFIRVRITWFLVLCVCFVDRCLSFCAFSFVHCVVCTSSIL